MQQPDRMIAGAFITDGEGRLLLLRRSSGQFLEGYWELPSGHVDAGESFDQALLREVLEETGLQIKVIGPLLGEFTYLSASGKLTAQKTHHVLCEDGCEIRLSGEHNQFVWLPPGVSVPEPITPESRGQVTEFFRQRPDGKFQRGADRRESRMGFQ